ncbi:four-carbon acid sugar kinase family protein [Streptomyces axinellae]|uniref:four-carbon acid sugar kinase family protein n=1 Tax=Streptomyces axinellae TaxID=552788 RepID=UPI003CD09908
MATADAEVLIYKVCSTFDSSPTRGSIGRGIELLHERASPTTARSRSHRLSRTSAGTPRSATSSPATPAACTASTGTPSWRGTPSGSSVCPPPCQLAADGPQFERPASSAATERSDTPSPPAQNDPRAPGAEEGLEAECAQVAAVLDCSCQHLVLTRHHMETAQKTLLIAFPQFRRVLVGAPNGIRTRNRYRADLRGYRRGR